jgi:hypothetical protein
MFVNVEFETKKDYETAKSWFVESNEASELLYEKSNDDALSISFPVLDKTDADCTINAINTELLQSDVENMWRCEIESF